MITILLILFMICWLIFVLGIFFLENKVPFIAFVTMFVLLFVLSLVAVLQGGFK